MHKNIKIFLYLLLFIKIILHGQNINVSHIDIQLSTEKQGDNTLATQYSTILDKFFNILPTANTKEKLTQLVTWLLTSIAAIGCENNTTITIHEKQKIQLILSAQLLMNDLVTQEYKKKPHKPAKEIDQTTQAVLGHAQKITNSFFNILQKPHDVEQVGNNVASMLSDVVHIATEVMKPNQKKQHVITTLSTLDQSTIDAIACLLCAYSN